MGRRVHQRPRQWWHGPWCGQASYGSIGWKTNLYLRLTWQIFNSLSPLVGHRSGSDQSLWRNGHSLDLDAEILPALNAYTRIPSSSPCHFKRMALPIMFPGHFTPLTMGPILGPGLSSKTLFFKWPQRQSWRVTWNAVNNLQSRFPYLLQLYLNPISVLADVIFIDDRKFCEDSRDNALFFSLILHDLWNHMEQWMVLSKCLINCGFFFFGLSLNCWGKWGMLGYKVEH